MSVNLVLARYVCRDRKLLILLAAVKEMARVTKMELIVKVLHLDRS